MQRLTGWYRNLKKWHQGGLIGFALGVILSLLLFTEDIPIIGALGRIVLFFHIGFLLVFRIINIYFLSSSAFFLPLLIFALILFYTLLGTIWGLIQQINNPGKVYRYSFIYVLILSIYGLFNLVMLFFAIRGAL